jgi:flagellar hook-length control protein FliK
VPPVASETSAVHSHHHGLGARRDARAEAKQQSTPFEMLLDDTGTTPPPSPRDRAERPRQSSTADGASDTRRDRHVRDRHEDRAEKTDGTDPGESADAQQPTADTPPDEETSAASAEDTAGECGCEEEPAASDTIDATLLAAAADAQAQQQPDAGEQTPAVPVATLAPPAAGTADAAATDIAAAADAAIEAAGARNAQVPGANSGADVDAENGPEKGTTNAAGTGAMEAAGAGADAAEAGSADETGQKKTGEPSPANGSGAVDTNKTPRAKPSARVEKSSAAGAETAVRDRPGADAEAAAPAGADAAGNGEHAGADPVHLAARNAEQKPDAASRPHTDAPAATAEGAKPPVDAAQLATLHPGDRFANAASAAAQGSAQAGTQTGAPGSSAVPVAGLAIEIAARAQAGHNRFDIRLDPPELGRIDVRIDVDRSGQVTTRLVVEKSETLDLLRRDAPELERALQEAGLKTGDNGLQFALRDHTAGGQDSGENWRSNAAKLVVSDPEVTAAETAAAGYGRSLRLGTGIDIRV